MRAIIPTLNILIKTIGNSDGPDESYCKRPLKSKFYARAVISTINKLDVSTKMYSGGPVLERDENERKQILKSKI